MLKTENIANCYTTKITYRVDCHCWYVESAFLLKKYEVKGSCVGKRNRVTDMELVTHVVLVLLASCRFHPDWYTLNWAAGRISPIPAVNMATHASPEWMCVRFRMPSGNSWQSGEFGSRIRRPLSPYARVVSLGCNFLDAVTTAATGKRHLIDYIFCIAINNAGLIYIA